VLHLKLEPKLPQDVHYRWWTLLAHSIARQSGFTERSHFRHGTIAHVEALGQETESGRGAIPRFRNTKYAPCFGRVYRQVKDMSTSSNRCRLSIWLVYRSVLRITVPPVPSERKACHDSSPWKRNLAKLRKNSTEGLTSC
jgi:hypothetical protein